MCPVVNCVGECVDLVSWETHPKKAHLGTTINADALFTVLNQTGTGEIIVLMNDPAGNQVQEAGSLNVGFQPGLWSTGMLFVIFAGNYNLSLSITTTKDETDDDEFPIVCLPLKIPL